MREWGNTCISFGRVIYILLWLEALGRYLARFNTRRGREAVLSCTIVGCTMGACSFGCHQGIGKYFLAVSLQTITVKIRKNCSVTNLKKAVVFNL